MGAGTSEDKAKARANKSGKTKAAGTQARGNVAAAGAAPGKAGAAAALGRAGGGRRARGAAQGAANRVPDVRPNHPHAWSPALGEAFLALLRKTGNAAAAAGVLGYPNKFNNRRQSDPAFRKAWDEAKAEATARLGKAESPFVCRRRAWSNHWRLDRRTSWAACCGPGASAPRPGPSR